MGSYRLEEKIAEQRAKIQRLQADLREQTTRAEDAEEEATTMAGEVEELRGKLNQSAATQKRINREVLDILGEISPTNPEEHYIAPATLARRVRAAKAAEGK